MYVLFTELFQPTYRKKCQDEINSIRPKPVIMKTRNYKEVELNHPV